LAQHPDFAESITRSIHADALDKLITDWTSQHDLLDLEQVLLDAAVPATRIFTMADIFGDPHFKARDMLVQVPHDKLGQVTVPGIVPKMSGTPGSIRSSGGAVGRDTQHVLMELAGLSTADIERLCAQGVIFQAEQAAPHNSAPN
jgi:crotonobetainyl-CoA:carnitine CoA-transferase CaiB-like acyl-CoA transferase